MRRRRISATLVGLLAVLAAVGPASAGDVHSLRFHCDDERVIEVVWIVGPDFAVLKDVQEVYGLEYQNAINGNRVAKLIPFTIGLDLQAKAEEEAGWLRHNETNAQLELTGQPARHCQRVTP